MEHHLQQEIAEFVAQIAEIAARDGVGDLIGFLDGVGRDLAKFCSRSHGQPLPGVRSAAMISSRPEISREGFMLHRCVRGSGPGMPQDVAIDPAILTEILRLQFDRRTMRRAIGGVVPGIPVTVQGL